jgi:hypothetical protein
MILIHAQERVRHLTWLRVGVRELALKNHCRGVERPMDVHYSIPILTG